MRTGPRPGGFIGFTIVWTGQLVSVLASLMTQFALTVWVFERTGSATALGLAQVFFITPFLLFSPLAGVWIDRYNRKLMMMISDLSAGTATVMILVLQALGSLEVWHLYAAAVIQGLGNTFQWPAYSAAISTMLPREQYGRANGMMSLLDMGPGVFAPLLAGALLPFIGLTGILYIDVVTFIVAVLALLSVHVPQPPKTGPPVSAGGSIIQEALFGFHYIFARPSLLGLQMIFFFGNLFSGIAFTVLAPMILLRTNNNESVYGLVQSIGAVGGILGGLLMSAWGGPKRRVHGVLLGWIFTSLLEMVLFSLGRSVNIWAPALFFGSLFVPLLGGSNQAFWQSKVAPNLQGRVFSARRLIAWFTNPISPLIAGALADYVLEPRMLVPGSRLSRLFGEIFGTGPGSGMALLMFVCGFGGILTGLAGYCLPYIRNADAALPDHDAPTQSAAAPSA